MSRSTSAIVVVIVAGVISGAWLFWEPANTAPAALALSEGAGLQVVRIAPASGQAVEAEVYGSAEFVYELRNTGKQPLTGLRAAFDCTCRGTVEEPPAERLAPLPAKPRGCG